MLRSGPLTLRELEALTGLDGRTIRRMIELERRDGVPIVSDCKRGYWIGNSDEVQHFVRSMRRRAAEIVKTAEAIEDAAG